MTDERRGNGELIMKVHRFWIGIAVLASAPTANGGDAWRPRAMLSADDPATAMSFAPDGKTIAVGSGRHRYSHFQPHAPGRVSFWDVTEDRPVVRAALKLPGAPCSIAFAPDGRTLAVVDDLDNLKLFDAVSGRETAALGPPGQAGRGMSTLGQLRFSPDGETLAVSQMQRQMQRIVLRDVNTGKVRAEVPASEGKVFRIGLPSFAFAPDGKTFALGGTDGRVVILEAPDGRLHTRLKDQESAVLNVLFSADGKDLAVKTFDGRVSLWEAATGFQRASFATAPGPFPALAISPDGRTLATAVPDLSIRLFDVATGRESGTLRGHTGSVLCLAFSPDGRALASGGADRTVRVWDPAAGREVAALSGHKDNDQHMGVGAVWRLEFSPDGKALASMGRDEAVRLWSRAP
jgi:WD40 repeat protein